MHTYLEQIRMFFVQIKLKHHDPITPTASKKFVIHAHLLTFDMLLI